MTGPCVPSKLKIRQFISSSVKTGLELSPSHVSYKSHMRCKRTLIVSQTQQVARVYYFPFLKYIFFEPKFRISTFFFLQDTDLTTTLDRKEEPLELRLILCLPQKVLLRRNLSTIVLKALKQVGCWKRDVKAPRGSPLTLGILLLAKKRNPYCDTIYQEWNILRGSADIIKKRKQVCKLLHLVRLLFIAFNL